MTPLKEFINRDNEIEELRDLLKYNKNVVITGPVGVGKSEIARKYTEAFSSEYDRVVWVDGEDFEGNIFSLLKDLNILLPDALQSTMGIQNAMSDAYDTLSNDHTLIVYDNVEMNEKLFKFLPKYGCYPLIRILMTSQDPRWPSHIISYPLLPLKLINAFTYMVDNIYDDGSMNQKEIKHFLERVVGRHPLLCRLSAAYVRKHQLTVRQYKELLEDSIADLTGTTPTTKDAKFAGPIHAAVNLAISALESNNQRTAIHLLYTLSFLDCTNMETKLLRFFKGERGAYPEQLLHLLEDYGLIEVRSQVDTDFPNDKSYSMYSFIRRVLQDNVTDTETTKCIQDLSSMVSQSRTASTRHVVPLIKRYRDNNDMLQILKIHKNTVRLALENEGRYVMAKDVVACFFIHELKYEFKAGESFMNKFKYGRALEVFEDVLKNQINHLGELHPDSMRTKKAIEDCKRKSRILGDDE